MINYTEHRSWDWKGDSTKTEPKGVSLGDRIFLGGNSGHTIYTREKISQMYLQRKKGVQTLGKPQIRSAGLSTVNGNNVHFSILIIALWLRKVFSLGGGYTGTLGAIFAVFMRV